MSYTHTVEGKSDAIPIFLSVAVLPNINTECKNIIIDVQALNHAPTKVLFTVA